MWYKCHVSLRAYQSEKVFKGFIVLCMIVRKCLYIIAEAGKHLRHAEQLPSRTIFGHSWSTHLLKWWQNQSYFITVCTFKSVYHVMCCQHFQTEVNSHQPLTSSVLHAGQHLLSCINTSSPCQSHTNKTQLILKEVVYLRFTPLFSCRI